MRFFGASQRMGSSGVVWSDLDVQYYAADILQELAWPLFLSAILLNADVLTGMEMWLLKCA